MLLSRTPKRKLISWNVCSHLYGNNEHLIYYSIIVVVCTGFVKNVRVVCWEGIFTISDTKRSRMVCGHSSTKDFLGIEYLIRGAQSKTPP